MAGPHGRIKATSGDVIKLLAYGPPMNKLRLSGLNATPPTLKLVWRYAPWATLGLGFTTLLAVVTPLSMVWVGKLIVDAVVGRDEDAALFWILIELALAFMSAVTTRVQNVLTTIVSGRLSIEVNLSIIGAALGLELRSFEDATFYDRLTRARREASTRPLGVVVASFTLAQQAATLAGYAALLAGLGWLSVLGLLIATVPATLAEARFAKQGFQLRNWRSQSTRRLAYIESVLCSDEHAKEVKLLGLGAPLLARYRTLGEQFYSEDRALALKRASWMTALSVLGTGAFYGCYAVVGLAAAAGAMTLGTMTLYVASFRQGQLAFQGLLGAIASLYENNLYMTNLFEFFRFAEEARTRTPSLLLSAEAQVGDSPPFGSAPEALSPMEHGIRFENVGFRYDGAETWALRGINLFIPAGQSLALVGKNGAGKTTFIKLLTRLYTPSEGRVLLDGRDLASWPEDALRGRLAVLFQDFSKYQFTVGENIGFGDLPHIGDVERLDRAIDRGGAREVVAGLPKGVASLLGRWFEGGLELSGGQWQRIALARAHMREGADILVLDEPTAALDAEAEHRVFEHFQALTRGRTCILISHRFPTVRMADSIVVIEQGTIRERGSHAELLDAGGRYAELFALQASGYAD